MKTDLKISYPGSEKVYLEGKISSTYRSTQNEPWSTTRHRTTWAADTAQCADLISAP